MSGSRPQVSPEQREAFRDAMLADTDALVLRICDAVREHIPSYRDVSDDVFAAGVRGQVELIVGAAPAGRDAVSDLELARLSEVGEARARDGVAIDEMLLAWRQGVQLVLDHGREVADDLGMSADELLEFIEALLAWSDRAMAIAAAGHRGAELELARRQHEERGRLVGGLLLGSLSPTDARAQAEAQGFDVTLEYVAVRAALDTDAARSALERALGFHDTTRPRAGLSATIDGDLAGLLRTAPSGELPLPVGVGPPRPLERLAESFALATRALCAARAFGLAGSHSFETLGLLPAIADDEAVGEALRRRYLDPLSAGSGAEIADSLRAYFACEMHVERAAEQLFIHANTLRYRIGRFEELTGASLRDPVTAFEVWWALTSATAEGGHHTSTFDTGRVRPQGS